MRSTLAAAVLFIATACGAPSEPPVFIPDLQRDCSLLGPIECRSCYRAIQPDDGDCRAMAPDPCRECHSPGEGGPLNCSYSQCQEFRGGRKCCNFSVLP